jgi:hypothetical protein
VEVKAMSNKLRGILAVVVGSSITALIVEVASAGIKYR